MKYLALGQQEEDSMKNSDEDFGGGEPTKLEPPATPGVHSKADTPNPKDLLGAKKPSMTKLPAIAVAHANHAMMNGAEKYGAFNWRSKKVIASIYIDAAIRHLFAYFEGEQIADDSGVHHLGHAIASIAILLDAESTGNLIDDRPIVGDSTKAYTTSFNQISETIGKRKSENQKVPKV
jgi:hypothetical protein